MFGDQESLLSLSVRSVWMCNSSRLLWWCQRFVWWVTKTSLLKMILVIMMMMLIALFNIVLLFSDHSVFKLFIAPCWTVFSLSLYINQLFASPFRPFSRFSSPTPLSIHYPFSFCRYSMTMSTFHFIHCWNLFIYITGTPSDRDRYSDDDVAAWFR